MRKATMEKLSVLGLIFLSLGIPLTIFSFFLFSNTGLTAFGLACIILGGTMVLTPWNPIPEPSIKGMLEGSCLNIEVLLEEFDAEEGAIYLPPSENRVYSYVPLSSNPDTPDLDRILSAPRRVITDSGGSPGLFVFPPGSELIRNSGIDADMGLEAALSFVLNDFVEVVDSVVTTREGNEIEVRLGNPQIATDFTTYRRVLGSIPTSIAGSVIAFALNSPVKFSGEVREGDEIKASFRVVSESG